MRRRSMIAENDEGQGLLLRDMKPAKVGGADGCDAACLDDALDGFAAEAWHA